jgi:hypothetical protein
MKMANDLVSVIGVGSAGYGELLRLATLGKAPISEDALVHLENIAQIEEAAPSEADLDEMMRALEGNRFWNSDQFIPNIDSYHASIRWSLSQYPAFIGRHAIRIAMHKADRHVQNLKVTEQCEILKKATVDLSRGYLKQERWRIENQKRIAHDRERSAQDAIEAEKRREEAEKVRQQLHSREVRKLSRLAEMPVEMCDSALCEASRFDLRFDDTKATDWIPTGIKYLCHVHSRGVEDTASARELVRRCFAMLKMGGVMVRMEYTELLDRETKRVDGVARRMTT